MGAGWAATIAMAVLAASRWLDAPTVEYLVLWTIATIVSASFAWRLRGARRNWALACVVMTTAALIIAVRAQRELARVTTHWAEWQESRAVAGLGALGESLTEAERRLASDAAAALRAPADRDGAFAHLNALVRGPEERGLVVFRGDSAFAWAGRFRVAPDSMSAGAGISASDFYLTLYATARQGSDHAVATLLLSAAPPADRLSHPLSRRIARDA